MKIQMSKFPHLFLSPKGRGLWVRGRFMGGGRYGWKHVDLKGLGIVFIKIIPRFFVILQGTGLQILSLCFLCLLIR